MINFRKLAKSFTHAWAGVRYALEMEQNFRIMSALVILSFVLMLVKPVEVWEKIALVLAGFFMLAVELLNTSLEKAIDLILPSSLEGIKKLKDIAAAAALAASVGWLLIVVIILTS